MKTIRFVKMHGAGNDFVLIDDRDASFPADGRVIAAIAPRGVGIGCEGVILVQASRSADFRIWCGAAEEAFRVHMGGLYQKRCGIAKTEPWTHWTAGACHTNVVRGVFAPEEGTLPKGVRWFDIIRQSTDWTGGERLTLAGGWHDAADYDRRPAHLAVVNDLCAAYLMRPGNFRDGQLAIPESANGIPDILDEAEWGLRHLRAGQQADGGVGTWIETTGHPVPGSDAAHDTMPYALSRATRASNDSVPGPANNGPSSSAAADCSSATCMRAMRAAPSTTLAPSPYAPQRSRAQAAQVELSTPQASGPPANARGAASAWSSEGMSSVACPRATVCARSRSCAT